LPRKEANFRLLTAVTKKKKKILVWKSPHQFTASARNGDDVIAGEVEAVVEGGGWSSRGNEQLWCAADHMMEFEPVAWTCRGWGCPIVFICNFAKRLGQSSLSWEQTVWIYDHTNSGTPQRAGNNPKLGGRTASLNLLYFHFPILFNAISDRDGKYCVIFNLWWNFHGVAQKAC